MGWVGGVVIFIIIVLVLIDNIVVIIVATIAIKVMIYHDISRLTSERKAPGSAPSSAVSR